MSVKNDFTKYGNATPEILEAANINPWALKMILETYIKAPPKIVNNGVRIKSHGQVITIEPEILFNNKQSQS